VPQPFAEAKRLLALALAKAYQDATGFQLKQPPGFAVA
jgi:hypothetical protein